LPGDKLPPAGDNVLSRARIDSTRTDEFKALLSAFATRNQPFTVADKIYDSTFNASDELRELFADFVAIVRQLRRDCPWDREQTHESVKHLLVEEAYETVEAISDGDYDHLRKELGDILLHVVFHAVIAAESDRFTLEQVILSETEKLIRRHPHVFGDVTVSGVEDVLTNWESIKIREGEKTSAMEGVPRALPNLLRAFRIQEKAAGVGFDFPSSDEAWLKVEEELRELQALFESKAGETEKEDELGDFLFAVVNYARLKGLNPENALGATNARFMRRFQYIEQRLGEKGTSIVDASLEEMDVFWNEAKTRESGV
jgi:XTP/dITP diphosphohydrolase/tetrapyrrole methylase family protein/MazG family protein